MIKGRIALVLLLIYILLLPLSLVDHAQGEGLIYETGFVLVADRLIDVEFAQTLAQKEKGLSGRNLDKNNYRMVFVFDKPGRVNFWMKNTKIDLSIAFIDRNNRIDQIESLKSNSLKIISSRSDQIQYAFEVPRGYFKKLGIKIGDEFLIFR